MKALTTAGLTQLIQLIKDNYIPIGTLATVADTGSYTDLSDKPTINDLTSSAQQDALNSNITAALVTQIGTNQIDIATINGKIPSAADTSNQLADKAFVNSTVTTLLARYITSSTSGDSFATNAALIAGPYYLDGTAVLPADLHNNDYAMVMEDETHDNKPARYIWSGSQWSFQYVLNNTTFTQAQVDALNSTITSNLVTSYSSHIADTDIHVTTTDKNNWNGKVNKISTTNQVYATDNSGNQTSLTYNTSATASYIVQRDSNAQITVPQTPTADTHAASKKYVDDGLDGKQPNLVSGTNIKSVNGTTLLGSGDLSTYPAQSGNNGKYLTTNGTVVSWAEIPVEIPTQAGNDGKFLTTNGASVSWATVDALPSRTSHSGKFLTNDGTSAYWTAISQVPSQTGHSGKFLTTDGSAASWAEVDAFPDQTGNNGKFLTTDGTDTSWTRIASYDATNKRLVLS